VLLDLLAEGLGCKAVVIAMTRRGYAEPSAGKCEAWSPLGFQLDSVIFAKRLSLEAEQPNRPATVALC
jgi:hypothetical protein